MRRRYAKYLSAAWIPMVAVSTLTTACSKSNPEPVDVAPTAEVAVAQTPPPAEPVPASSAPPVTSTAPAPAPVAAVPAPEHPETFVEPPPPPPPEPATPAVDAKVAPKEPAPDPLKWLQESEAARIKYEQDLVALAAARDSAAADVTRAEKDLLAFKNPYLPRPKLDPKEAAEVAGKGGVDRAAWAEARIAEARAALAAAQTALDTAKANPPVR